MKQELIEQIQQLKKKFEPDGFIIVGVFGSYVRGDNTLSSDLDLLVELTAQFKSKFRGFKAISKLDEIEKDISDFLQVKVDVVQKSTLSPIARKYILDEVAYV